MGQMADNYKGFFETMSVPTAFFKAEMDDHNLVKTAIILDCNEAYLKMAQAGCLAEKKEELINHSYFDLAPHYDPRLLNYFKEAAINRKRITGELNVSEKGCWVFIEAAPLKEPHTCFMSFLDITRCKSENNELNKMAYIDRLTQVYNRNAYEKKLKALKSAHQPLGVVLIDINGLKQVNDNQGHQAGDNMIIQAARFLTVFCGHGLPYRIGGDEFVLLLEGVDRLELKYIVSMIHSYKNVYLSCGHSWRDDGSCVEKMIKEADEAMYQEKKFYYLSHDRRRRPS